ncbi:MAG: 1-deoxy-D-xylulose-5-phosphate synthase [Acidobacteria bacterium]|jgi:1-deoxy-D-xylulose-5-phosphate synthase|nr:1-deoxy-D-xylulose-5-phosphate synthase [Acidobacteriota bacterium]
MLSDYLQLNKINSPKDLKTLSYNEIKELSAEIREIIVKVVSENGGHLSSNLGVVDLTLALHRVFDAPRDKIIWDVGHQCYTHKIITGRKDRIHTIRKKNGLLGFPDIEESEYDVLNTGHASTSLAFASGLAVARDNQGEDHHIIAVIGDGALTGGLALEALNHIGQVKQRLIIVLNDNKMSISPNVGAISKYLNYLASGRPYTRLKEKVYSIFKAIPLIGKSLVGISRSLLMLMRRMMVPGSFFNDLGVMYIGPIKGHDFKEMEKAFQDAKKHDAPILLHVVTEKGQGYKPAEEDPCTFHSSAPFDISNGKFKPKCNHPSYSEVFGRAVLKLVREDKKIIALTAAMPEGTGLDLVQNEFPQNFYDVGIAEQYMLDFAGGLALGGMKPVVGIYSTFMQRAIDQIIHDITLMKIPVVVGIDRGGLVGGDGPTHQGIYDIALLRPLPEVVLMAPKDENELQHMVYTGMKLQKPVFIRYPKEHGIGVPLDLEFKELPLGKSEVLRDGIDGVILAVGTLVYRALEAAEKLHKEEGIDLTVINIRYIKPLDTELILKTVREKKGRLNNNGKIITIEDGIRVGGFGTQIRELLVSENIKDYCILSLGVPEEDIVAASREELLAQYHLNAEGIFAEIKKLFGK